MLRGQRLPCVTRALIRGLPEQAWPPRSPPECVRGPRTELRAAHRPIIQRRVWWEGKQVSPKRRHSGSMGGSCPKPTVAVLVQPKVLQAQERQRKGWGGGSWAKKCEEENLRRLKLMHECRFLSGGADLKAACAVNGRGRLGFEVHSRGDCGAYGRPRRRRGGEPSKADAFKCFEAELSKQTKLSVFNPGDTKSSATLPRVRATRSGPCRGSARPLSEFPGAGPLGHSVWAPSGLSVLVPKHRSSVGVLAGVELRALAR